MMNLGIGIALAAAVASPLNQKLPVGNVIPTAGATCRGSAALGTANVYGSGKATTVVNAWEITKTTSGPGLGWVLKAYDGQFWYEDPLQWKFERIGRFDESYFARNFNFVPCFSRDLQL